MKEAAFESFDGARLAYRTLGEGPPIVLLHGFLANAQFNWISPGIAKAIAESGHQAIMLDLRAHGGSAAPEDAAAYPADVLARDGEAFVAHLGLSTYDIVGYSIGSRTAVRMMVRGAKPRRVVLGGMGDTGILDWPERAAFFEDAVEHGVNAKDPRAGKTLAGMIARSGLNQKALIHLLRSRVNTSELELVRIKTPILVLSGADDDDNGSAEELAAMLPHGRAARVAGNHLSAMLDPAFATRVVDFLGG